MQSYNFWLGGGHPAADFVNTLDDRLSPSPEERLGSYEALVEFSRQSHLIEAYEADTLLQYGSTTSAETVLSAAVRMREALHAAFQALIKQEQPDQADIFLIESEIRRATAARHLVPGDVSLIWRWQKPDAPERPLWELALAAEDLLTSEAIRRTRMCAADDCGAIFVDYSRANSRRWCSMADCGNRHKVRQYRSSHK